MVAIEMSHHQRGPTRGPPQRGTQLPRTPEFLAVPPWSPIKQRRDFSSRKREHLHLAGWIQHLRERRQVGRNQQTDMRARCLLDSTKDRSRDGEITIGLDLYEFPVRFCHGHTVLPTPLFT